MPTQVLPNPQRQTSAPRPRTLKPIVKEIMTRGVQLHDDASATRRSLASFRSTRQTVLAAFGVFLVDKILWLDGHVNDIWCIMIKSQICVDDVRYCQVMHDCKILPFSGALSSSSFPNDISLIELGLDGFCSHSISNVSPSVWDFRLA
jgi:hypothetical protein